MQLFSIGPFISVGYLTFFMNMALGSGQDTKQRSYFIDIREYKVLPSTSAYYSTICANVESCYSGAGKFCETLDSTKYYVSCPTVEYSAALKTCNNFGGQLLQNNTKIITTLGKLPHNIFYKCKKFWICVKDCTVVATRPPARKTNPIPQSLNVQIPDFNTTTTSSTTSTAKSTTPLVKAQRQGNHQSGHIPTIVGVVVAVIAAVVISVVVVIIVLRRKLKEKAKLQSEQTKEAEPMISVKVKKTNGVNSGTEANTQPPTTKKDDLTDLVNRHKEFKKIPTKLDSMLIQNLALMGFVPTGTGDQVRCVYCDVILSDWKEDDDVFEIHRAAAPDCGLILYLMAKHPRPEDLRIDIPDA